MTDRERATVLAALRFWQDEMTPNEGPPCYPEHFAEADPLNSDEIDDRCERLNGQTPED